MKLNVNSENRTDIINIGSKRECFFDTFLINESDTTAERRLHKPVRREVLLTMDAPWEGKYTTMFSTVYAEGKWRMYYNTVISPKEKFVCYAESDDAITWVRPNLGMIDFHGSKENNIILDVEAVKAFDFNGFDNLSVFYDENPECPADEKYKMTCWWMGHAALIALFSADGIHFTKSRFITDEGEFDSQNRAFYSEAHGKYFAYFRGEHEPSEDILPIDRSYSDKVANALFDPETFLMRDPGKGTYSFMRDVRVMESDDFVNWSKPRPMEYTGAQFQIYNNVVFPYPRAPHLFVGLPLRYVERKAWTKNYDELCGKEERLARMKTMARLGLSVTDGLFMCSRDGYRFEKYDEAILPPPPENPESFVYGDGTAFPALIEVPSQIPGADNEYMIIVRESFRSVADSFNKLVKYTSRLDGFVSLHAGGEARRVVTKEFIYDGDELFANISTSARGHAYFTLKSGKECFRSVEIFGNSVNKRIRFEDDGAVSALRGKTVTLEVELYDADIYAIKFEQSRGKL